MSGNGTSRSSQHGPRSVSVQVEPFRPRVGAVVSGINLAPLLDDITNVRLQKALLQHGVLFFRYQSI